MNRASTFANLFDIVAITTTGIAAPVIGADDIDVDGDTGSDEQPPQPLLNPTNDDQQDF